MNIKRIGIFTVKTLVGLVIALLVGQFVLIGMRYYSAHKIRNTLQYRSQLYMNRQMAFIRYEITVSDYVDHPNKNNKKALAQSFQALNANLDATEQVYGLVVKRWIDLYKIWALQSQQQILASPKTSNTAPWDYTLLSYEQLIEKAVKQGDQAYKDNALNTLLYPAPFARHTASRTAMKHVQTIYQQKAKALIPAAVKKMQQTTNPMNLMPLRVDLNSPQGIAENIAFIQYGSRFAPFVVKSKTDTLCATLRSMGSIDGKTNEALAVCAIAEKRLKTEAEMAKKRYGNLSYSAYFEQYVQPLIPKYKKALKAKSQSKRSLIVFNACDPSMKPVISFRDPQVDAQVAAYAIYGYRYCHTFFKDSDSTYGKMQVMRYGAKGIQNKLPNVRGRHLVGNSLERKKKA